MFIVCMYVFVVYLTTLLVFQAKDHSIHKNREHKSYYADSSKYPY